MLRNSPEPKEVLIFPGRGGGGGGVRVKFKEIYWQTSGNLHFHDRRRSEGIAAPRVASHAQLSAAYGRDDAVVRVASARKKECKHMRTFLFNHAFLRRNCDDATKRDLTLRLRA